MQNITKNFPQKLRDNLKVGQFSRPRCVVQVDRMAFIPGKIEQITIEDYKLETQVEIQKTWIQADESGLFNGETVINTDEMVFPVKGMSLANVIDEFGTPRSGGSNHTGIDIALDSTTYPERMGIGTPILAAWGGRVSTVRTSDLYDSYGIYVDIVHYNGLRTRYAHLNNVYVSVGDIVYPGQVIGEGGNTGNVYYSKKPVKGTYSDPNSMRYKGYGAHLHFEVHEPVDDNGNFRAVNPRPYLEKSKVASSSFTNQGEGVVNEGSVVGYKNGIIMKETFARRDWYNNKIYSFTNNFLKLSTIEKVQYGELSNWNTLTFNKGLTEGNMIVGMTIKLTMIREGYMDITFRSNFSGDDGDLFYVTVNDPKTRSVNQKKFDGLNKVQKLEKIYIPSGDVSIDIIVCWGGKDANVNGRPQPKKFSIGEIKIVEISPTNEANYNFYSSKGYSNKQENFTKLQGGYWEEKEITNFIFSDDSQVFDLSVGEFVYVDTITLDNVISCDISTSLEQECAEAVVTITNPDGFYSPSYNSAYFPELGTSSPFSYFFDGYQIGVLSNNTPIRIYMGYGDELIRVFTGLIDKVDCKNSPSTITITARDMYKKVVDKVLTETKQYPSVDIVDNFPEGGAVELEKVAWLKSAVIQDLVAHAGMFGWRQYEEDLRYPDAVIEESYLISVNQEKGTFVRAVPGKEGEFEIVSLESVPTPLGWLNPYTTEYGKTYHQYKYRVGECINEELKDTHYRSYCDRYGTYRLETINYNKPIVDTYTYRENLSTIEVSLDFSRARSHIIVIDEEGNKASFLDKEILMELKGEIRTASVVVPWAKSYEIKKMVASRLFEDMKRICRSIRVMTPCNPTLDLLDKIRILDKDTSTNAIFTIKGIRWSYNADSGLVQYLDLFWSAKGTII